MDSSHIQWALVTAEGVDLEDEEGKVGGSMTVRREKGQGQEETPKNQTRPLYMAIRSHQEPW